MLQLDVICDMRISFSMNNSWMSLTLDIEIVSAIMDESNFSLTWDQGHCYFCLVLFLYICRMSKSDFVCVLYINLKLRWSWTPSWT
jgi:hypothetical protein